jgi:hypothetical protein
MRTTLNLPDDLARRAKRQAVDEGTTLTGLIVEGLRARLGRTPTTGRPPVSEARGGLQPGVNWDELEPADAEEERYR